MMRGRSLPAWVFRVIPGLLVLCAVPSRAEEAPSGRTLVVGAPGTRPILPPELPWDGATRRLLVKPDDEWATPFERDGLDRTPRYDETVAWLRRLDEASPEIALVSIGKSVLGRDLWMVVASRGGATTPEALRSEGKPVLLAHGGIHAGEIDGKDAGMMLLRDMTVRDRQRALLEGASFLFIPILNVDGHERFSAVTRLNQRGPVEAGWRTNARNQNLNRDFAKLDTPEIRAVVAVLRDWQPDLYADVHVTDGVDYQYDITWGYNGPHAYSPNTVAWLDNYLTPALNRDLGAEGHVPGPLVFSVDPNDLSRGISNATTGPRYSNGYGDARHVASLLVENHSLKPYVQRVLGTVVLLEGMLRELAAHGRELRRASTEDRALRYREVTLAWKVPEDVPPPTTSFLGVRSRLVPSAVSGGLRVEWTGEPVTLEIPYPAETEPAVSVSRPRAYWIPAMWDQVIERLSVHGIEMERVEEERTLEVTMYRVTDAHLEPAPYEGHAMVRGTPVAERREERFPAGSVRVPTDQPLGDLAVLLLEPGCPDSYFQWGFFLEVLPRTEYAEGYVMEPMAEEMLRGNPELAREFARKLGEDREFAGSPGARLDWFYRQTPFLDERWGLYPVARED